MTNEEFYDKEIAPELLRLAALCQQKGMGFVASVEYDPINGGRGTTYFIPPDEKDKLSCAQRIVHWASQCNGNIDSLFLACDKHGQKHGHSSVYLQLLGNRNVQYSENESAAITIFKPL